MGPTLDVRGACGLATIGNSTFVSCVQTIVSGRFSVLSCRAFTNIISYTEALDFLSGTLVFTITDLETLERLSQMKRNIDATSLKSVSPVLHSRVTKLNIIMRWPLELYQSYETHATDSADLSTELLATKKSWRRLAETIERFDSSVYISGSTTVHPVHGPWSTNAPSYHLYLQRFLPPQLISV